MAARKTVWSEETVRRKNGLISYTGYLVNMRGQLEEIKYTTPDVYIYALLNKESDEWVMRVYDIPSVDDECYSILMRKIFVDMKEFGVSAAWAKEGKITAVKFIDDGIERPWDPGKEEVAPDFRNFAIQMSLKTSKYMSMFSQATYANMDVTVIFVDEDDHRNYPHHEGALFVKITNLEGDEAYLNDGNCFMRPEVRDEAADIAYERILPHDPEKASRIRRQLKKACAFNGRLVTGHGTLKGDFLVSYVLNTDVEADAGNVKPDISTRDMHTGLLQMFPQEQFGSIYTNRQMVASFYDSLLDVPTPGREDSLNLVKDAMADYTDELIDRFRSGEMMFHVDSLGREQQDALRNNFQKMEAWTEAGFSMNESVYLLMVEAGQVVDMHTPDANKQDKKRRMPVPCSSRHSVRNATGYKKIYGVELKLKFGEAFTDPDYGVFVSDETYKVVAPIWGGADLDDHVELHYRVALDDHEFFGVKAGDIVMVAIRNPIGIVSDGKAIGTEYYVLKADAIEKVGLEARFGELPGLEMASLPLCSAQLDLPEPTWTPKEHEAPAVYSKKWLKEQIELRAVAQGAYGMHVNMYMAARMYNIPFTFVAPEEDIVDLFQQKPEEEGMRFWEDNNEMMRQNFLNAGVPMDYWIKKRCGLKKLPTERGPITDIVEYHFAQIERFEAAAKEHIKLVRETNKVHYEEVSITRKLKNDNRPALVSFTSIMEDRLRKEWGLTATNERGNYSQTLTHGQFEELGNRVVARLDELVASDESNTDEALVDLWFIEAHAWLWQNMRGSYFKDSSGKIPVRSMYYDTDQKIMMGAMLDRLIKVLA